MQQALGRAQWVWGFFSGLLWVECIQAPWLFPLLLALLHPCSWRELRERRGQEGTCPGSPKSSQKRALSMLSLFLFPLQHIFPEPSIHFSTSSSTFSQQDKPQEGLVTKCTSWPKQGQQKLLAPKVPGWWLCAQGRSQLEHLLQGALETTPWDADVIVIFAFLCLSASSPPLSGFLLPWLSLCLSFSSKNICLSQGNNSEYNP